MTEISKAIADHLEKKMTEKVDLQKSELAKFLAKNKDPMAAREAEIECQDVVSKIKHDFQPANWLTSAANRAKSISLATHSPKLTHSSAKGTSFLSPDDGVSKKAYVTTNSLPFKAMDAFGGAAALDVAKVLMITVGGDSLARQLLKKDVSSLSPFIANQEVVEQWRQGLTMALHDETLRCDDKQKQVYFPVSEDLANAEYHLLCPLQSSSLVQKLHDEISNCRYGDSVEVRKAFRNGIHNDSITQSFRELAYLQVGGANPQNVSLLTSGRGGVSFLLNSAPPKQLSRKTPLFDKQLVTEVDVNIFSAHFKSKVSLLIERFVRFIEDASSKGTTFTLRYRRDYSFTLPIIDLLLLHAQNIQSLDAGWSSSALCRMNSAYAFWLDPMNPDSSFQEARESKEWLDTVANDFSEWLISCLSSPNFALGNSEKLYFKKIFLNELKSLERVTQTFGVK
jgi:CRISPR-associated protein Csy1